MQRLSFTEMQWKCRPRNLGHVVRGGGGGYGLVGVTVVTWKCGICLSGVKREIQWHSSREKVDQCYFLFMAKWAARGKFIESVIRKLCYQRMMNVPIFSVLACVINRLPFWKKLAQYRKTELELNLFCCCNVKRLEATSDASCFIVLEAWC